MRYDQNFIEKVRDANNIVDVIGQYTDLKGRGDQHMGLCPFPDHNEKSPSFSVSESKQVYHCFGCKKSGNIFTFLEQFNGFSFVEALEYLAGRAHIEMPKFESGEAVSKPNTGQKQAMHKANKFAAVFFHQTLKNLPSNHKAKQYLEKRGLSQELVDTFRLGYAPESWDELVKFFASKKVPVAVAENLGLIKKNRMGGYFDLFRDRLMFPIFAIDDSVIGFGGRIIDQGQPKYINSLESEVFKKGQSFYGLNLSAKHIRAQDKVIVVEGYMDLLALYGVGIQNVVATLGTALTESHVRMLKRSTKNVVLVFDGDSAGQTASERSLIHFLNHDLPVQVLRLPQGQDPDDFIKSVGVQAFNEAIDQAQDLFLNQLQLWMADYKGQPKDKIDLIDKVTPLLNALSDQRLYQLYLEQVARRLDENPRKLHTWIRNGQKAADPAKMAPVGSMEPQPMKKRDLRQVPSDELVLASLSLKYRKFMDFFVSEQAVELLSHQALKDLFKEVVAAYGQQPNEFDKLTHLVISQVRNPEKIVNLITISSAKQATDKDEIELKECFIRVKDRYLQRKAAELVESMKHDHSEEKLERFVNIQNDRKALQELKNRPL